MVSGRGRVQTIGGDGFAETPLEAGALVWFTPGTIHRLVNDSGDLEILVVMANRGLPEAGDMVVLDHPDVLADRDRYLAHAALPAGATTTAGQRDPADARPTAPSWRSTTSVPRSTRRPRPAWTSSSTRLPRSSPGPRHLARPVGGRSEGGH